MGEVRKSSPTKVVVTVCALIALVLAATAVGWIALSKTFYSPSAFVQNYLQLLGAGRAADALELPGMQGDGGGELDANASSAILRASAMQSLTDIEIVSESTSGDITLVTASFEAGGTPGEATFKIAPDGWSGLAPAWRFAEPPLTIISAEIEGSMDFTVNGFQLDKRQISPSGVDAPPTDPAVLLAFVPGRYDIGINNQLAKADAKSIVATAPLGTITTELIASPTEAFVTTVQDEVDDFLAACVTQTVLQPTGCPFGLETEERINGDPEWSIATSPVVTLSADGANWQMPSTDGKAQIDVELQSLFDGSISDYTERIPFSISADVRIFNDGTVAIQIDATDPW